MYMNIDYDFVFLQITRLPSPAVHYKYDKGVMKITTSKMLAFYSTVE